MVSRRFLYSKQFKELVEGCKTSQQVRKLLEDYGIPIQRETTQEVGGFSIWINDVFRIYQNYAGQMVCQKWQKVDMTYSGAPMYPSAKIK